MNKEPNGRAMVEQAVKLKCKLIGHSEFCISMSGGYIWWKCRRCGLISKTEDQPFI